MTFRPISELIRDLGENKRPIAQMGGRYVDLATFRNDIIFNAKSLKDRGCRRGVVAVHDTYWAAVGLMALLHARAVAVFPSSLQDGALQQCKADVIVTDHAGKNRNSTSDHLLTSGSQDIGVLSEIDPGLAQIELFTSGSTGEPKSVVKTLAEMQAEAQTIEAEFGADLESGVVFATVPHHHLYGLSFKVMWPLCSGRRFISKTYESWAELAPELMPKAILVTSPAHLSRIPELPALAHSRLSLVLSAGAALSDEAAHNAMLALAQPVTDILGSTETGVIAFCQRLRGNTLWRAFSGVKVRELSNGHMAVQSPHIARTVIGDPWYETADAIELKSDGRFRLRGRTDRVLKVEGHRISIPELEQWIARSALVNQSAVFAMDTETTRLGAVVVLSPNGSNALNEIGSFRLGRQLRQELSQTFPPSALPKHWRFVPEIPVSPLGKRREADLAALFKVERRKVLKPVVHSAHRSDAGVELNLSIPANLAQMKGHFPDLPIVPGVALLNWAIKFSGEYLDTSIAVTKAFQVKFRRIITAPSDIQLTLSPRPSQRQIAFEYRKDEDVLSSGAFSLDQ